VTLGPALAGSGRITKESTVKGKQVNEQFGFQISDKTTVRELYLMLRTFPRRYQFKCNCGVVHTQSSLEMWAECSKCGYDNKLYHFADGQEIHDVASWVLLWLGVPKEKVAKLNLHPEDFEKEVDWSEYDRLFHITAEDIEACRKENMQSING